MDEFVYACPDHGTVAVIHRREIPGARPPSECPWCGGVARRRGASRDVASAVISAPRPVRGRAAPSPSI